MVVMELSWVGAIVMVTIIGLLLSWLGRAMSWFSNPLFIIPLYAVPSMLVVGELNVQWMKWVSIEFIDLPKMGKIMNFSFTTRSVE